MHQRLVNSTFYLLTCTIKPLVNKINVFSHQTACN